MRKIKLNLERLAVQSFDTTDDARTRRGTVRGHDSWLDPASYSEEGCVCPNLDSGPPWPCTAVC